MEVYAITAVQAATESPALAQAPHMQEPQPIDMAEVASSRNDVNSAFADLRSPGASQSFSVRNDWVNLTRSIVDGSTEGLLRPRVRELQETLEVSAGNPDAVSSEEIGLMMIRISEASAVTNVLSTSVNAVRKSVATLVERTG